MTTFQGDKEGGCHWPALLRAALSLFQFLALLVAVAFIAYGISRGELPVLFKKAVRVCMECIGLG